MMLNDYQVLVIFGCGHWAQIDVEDGPAGEPERFCYQCQTVRRVGDELTMWEGRPALGDPHGPTAIARGVRAINDAIGIGIGAPAASLVTVAELERIHVHLSTPDGRHSV